MATKGEIAIKKFLVKNKIKFVTQKTFKTCRNIRPLRFDFYLPKFNILIEYQGHQHFYPVKRSKLWSDEKCLIEFKKTKQNDKIKKIWCKDNGKKLIEIKYNSKNIFSKIKKEIE